MGRINSSKMPVEITLSVDQWVGIFLLIFQVWGWPALGWRTAFVTDFGFCLYSFLISISTTSSHLSSVPSERQAQKRGGGPRWAAPSSSHCGPPALYPYVSSPEHTRKRRRLCFSTAVTQSIEDHPRKTHLTSLTVINKQKS